MTSEVASEIWGELKRYVNTVDRAEAAETLVAVLIDHDESAEDIRDAFKNDADVKRALATYLDTDTGYEDEEETEDDDSDNDWED
jgi:hypothetical protein